MFNESILECLHRVQKKGTNSILGISHQILTDFHFLFHFYNLLKISNKAVIKYPIAPKTRHYTTLWCQKTSVSRGRALWQSCWKINSPEFWRVADNSCIWKWKLFITTSFTNLLCYCINFRYCLWLLADDFFVNSNNLIKSLWNDLYQRSQSIC